jgi:hypothetical protein
MKRSSRRTTLLLGACSTTQYAHCAEPNRNLCNTSSQDVASQGRYYGQFGHGSLAGLPPQSPYVEGFVAWLSHHMAEANGHDTRKVVGILLYFWRNVWKECNRCIFKNVQRNEFHVASMTKEDVDLYWMVKNNIS